MRLLSDLLNPINPGIANFLDSTLGDSNNIDPNQVDSKTDRLIEDAANLLGLDGTSLINDLSQVDFSKAIDDLNQFLLGNLSGLGNLSDLLDKSVKDLVSIVITAASSTPLGDLLNQSVQDLLKLPVGDTSSLTVGDLLDKSAKDFLDAVIVYAGDTDIQNLIDKSLRDILHLPIDGLIDQSILDQPIQDLLTTAIDNIGDAAGDLLNPPIDKLPDASIQDGLDPLIGDESRNAENGDRSLEQATTVDPVSPSPVNTDESPQPVDREPVDQDSLLGTALDDILLGSTNDNILNGGQGNDTLKGGNGNDTLMGGKGRDRLWGGQGLDQLIGGGGNDEFMLKAKTGLDTIEDFQNGRDRLSLSAGIDFGRLSILPKGKNTLIRLDGKPLALLNEVAAGQINAQDFSFARGI